jgi:hypothetical protein
MCGQPAVYLIRDAHGDRPLCLECVVFRHCGEDFSLLGKTSGSCACGHMPQRIDHDREKWGIEQKVSAA